MHDIFIHPNDTREYFLSDDKEHSYRFVLGVIDSLTMFHINQRVRHSVDDTGLGNMYCELVRYGLKGMEGPGVDFSTMTEQSEGKTLVKRSTIESLSKNVLVELGNEIARDNQLLPDELPNSSGAGQSTKTQGLPAPSAVHES